MRWLCALLALAAPAAADPLWQVELHAGYGVAMSGRGDEMTQRPTPLTLTGIVAIAVNDDPPLAGYGGIAVETLDRNAAGMVFGVELHPHDSHLHFAGGGVYMVAPYTLWGATASAGVCLHATHALAVCGDLQLTAFIAGDDLPDGHAVTQGQGVLGLVFDAL
ncbi:MAG TPA: hypothetical protein VIX73_05040 [Kofleriaceae bacterium]